MKKFLAEKEIRTVGELRELIEAVPSSTLLNIGTEKLGYSLDAVTYDGISLSLWTKEVSEFSGSPEQFCGDCLCRTCGRNQCSGGEQCAGCNSCTGVIETEEDCVNPHGYLYDDAD